VALKRCAVLYLMTLIVLIPLDFVFPGVIAKPFFRVEVGDMLGDLKVLSAAGCQRGLHPLWSGPPRKIGPRQFYTKL
jgi:hypothetical protein